MWVVLLLVCLLVLWPVEGSTTDGALCNIIASTNVQSQLTSWSCTTNGLASTDPCTWSNIYCITEVVVGISFNSMELTGRIYHTNVRMQMQYYANRYYPEYNYGANWLVQSDFE